MELRSTNQSTFGNIDWVTVIIYTIMVFSGVVCIYTASYDFDGASIFSFDEFSGKQMLWAGLSFVLGMFLLLIDARLYETYAYPIYAGIILLLIITIFIAPDVKGSHSWLVFGPVSLQPAEFAKFATALALGKMFSTYGFSIKNNVGNLFKAMLLFMMPIVIIIMQNETGSALVYLSLFLMLYREGMSGLILFSALCAVTYFVVALKFTETMVMGIPSGEFAVFILIMVIMVGLIWVYCKQHSLARNIALGYMASGIIVFILWLFDISINGYIYFISIISLASIYCFLHMLRTHASRLITAIVFAFLSIGFLFSVNYAFQHVLQDHQRNRILITLGTIEDPQGVGYNVNQSIIAIGSGGFAGKGFLNGTQTKLKYVPEQHTDFIFCTIGEEYGFIGSTLTLLLFLILILRIITIAERQPTAFGRVYAYCVASYFIIHFVINIGMVIGICPVIGIPLPFFSYGGSSLWGFTFLLFILLRIDASRREHHSY